MSRDRRVMETGLAETEEEMLTAAGTTRVFLATKAPYRNGQEADQYTILESLGSRLSPAIATCWAKLRPANRSAGGSPRSG